MNRQFVQVTHPLGPGVYNLEIKSVQISAPQGYVSQESFNAVNVTLPTPVFLLEGDIFNLPLQGYWDDFPIVTSGGGIIIPVNGPYTYHDTIQGSESIKAFKEIETTTVTPNWKCQYINVVGNTFALNLRVINRNPANSLANNIPNFWFDEPVPVPSSTNPSWPWVCLTSNHDLALYNSNSLANYFNVVIQIEYNKISNLPN